MTSPTSSNLQPTSNPAWIDVRKFAAAGDTVSGRHALPSFLRLVQDLRLGATDLAQKTVDWSARGESRTCADGSAQPWLHLQVQAYLPMTCQRCLTAVDIGVDLDRHFRFVADEAIAMAEDDAAEEDLLVVSKQFDLQALIEDELLMALPIVPKHDVCPSEVKLASTDEDFKAALTQKPNAFAALGSLKKLN